MAKKRKTTRTTRTTSRRGAKSQVAERFDRVREHAFSTLSLQQRTGSNLYLDERIYESGELIGPRRQQIMARRPSVLVFADDDPMANFAHSCRYLLYDAGSGELDRIVPAVFPPFVKAPPKTLKPFHQPVQYIRDPILFRPKVPFFPCLRRPLGVRYAILYSGMSNKRHLNDMEFLYRVLVDTYAFSPGNIYALSYDGTRNTQDGVQTKWPGDNSAYRIQLTGDGTRAAFEQAIDDLKGRIKRDDLLLIHTNNHGGYDGMPGTANLCTYPNWDAYYANDFANKLAELPTFRKLIVMMEQCHAGGFNNPIITKSTADATSVASAATEPNNSYVTADGNWDPFARDWIAAQAGCDPFGTALSFDPDTDHDGRISAFEAYHYADVVQDPRDTPNFSQSSAAGGQIAVGQEYSTVPWWCRIVAVDLRPWLRRIPPEELYARLHRLQPALERIAQGLDTRTQALEKQFAPRVQAVLEKEFRR
jgi:peptidase C13-like protein